MNLTTFYHYCIISQNAKCQCISIYCPMHLKTCLSENCTVQARVTITQRCLASYSHTELDQGIWLPGWGVVQNTTDYLLDSHTSLDLAYMFQNETALKGRPYWGVLNWYSGGGFVANLGNTLQVKGILRCQQYSNFARRCSTLHFFGVRHCNMVL